MIRARGDLEVFGSISDGFDGSRLSPGFDDQGWILTKGRQPHGADVVVPHGGRITLVTGTVFPSGKVLNYDVRIAGMEVAAGTRLPTDVTLAQPVTLARGTVLGAPVFDAAGNLLYAAGTVLADMVVLPAEARESADSAMKSLIDGIEMTEREMQRLLAKHGVKPIEAEGQKFDPHKHQAMIEIATDKAEPGTIVEEMQSGYMLKDRLLRPALVAVAKAG